MGWQDDLAGISGGQSMASPATKNTSAPMSEMSEPGNFQNDLNALGIKPVAPPASSSPPTASPPPATAQPATPPPQDTEWSALPSHIIPSAVSFGENIGHALLHPIQTAETVGDIGMGALEMMGIKGGEEHKPYAQAFGHMLADRYGGLDNIKRTIINDPVGVAADISSVFGGAGLAARGVGMAGAADAAATAARLTNPLSAVGVAAKPLGKAAAEAVGTTTFAGPRALEEAAAAGRWGGSRGAAFREQLSGKGTMEGPVTDAERALDSLVFDQKSKYMQDMRRLGLNTRQLSLGDTYQAVKDSQFIGGFGNTMSKNPITQATWKSVNDTVQEWALKGAQDPSYMTPIGLDGLKRQIGKLGPHSGESGAIISQVQKAIRGEITKGAPEYTQYMKTFESAQDTIDQIRKAFSLNDKASVDTKLRKLQSLMRNNVNTSYGYRTKLAEYLQDEAPDLMARLAGQALNPWTARGLGKLAVDLGLAGAGALVGAGGLSGGALGMAATLPFMSPRLMGNLAYGIGRTARLGQYGPAAFQFGRSDTTAGGNQP